MVNQNIWRWIRPVLRPVLAVGVMLLFYLLRVFPIKNNKVIVCVSAGRRYDDNQKYIIEEFHKLCPDADIVWAKDPKYEYEVPEWMRTVRWYSLRWIYEHATAKIWTNNCSVPDYFVKRKGQMYIETWHGGLGIKKMARDCDGQVGDTFDKTLFLKNASDMADVYISNSDHLSKIYRRAFRYHGPIWKCGYPKNDMLVNGNPEDGARARKELGIPENHKILLYAPTWRERFTLEQRIDMQVYNLDLQRLKKLLTDKFGGEWTMLIRFHPNLRLYSKGYQETHPEVKDVTDYQDMQRLLMATDVMVSDYSSCIFDAALRRIPCFTFATDFEKYKYEERGVYYEMKELPFPYAKDNDEMEQNVKAFDMDDYLKKWDAFTIRMGLNETGHSAKDIAQKMADFLHGKKVTWQNDYPVTIPKEI
ncbi:CDP-glycerol:poly(glycerophosphate) glycerophosphotransferase [Xylanibacter ruminicola]|uniref:CDP-glycerol:poly(Glycerophosphate) glycerophosphotransferase n=1 Tax=Xylanibacter ruminicola TaxID=839 RepID=A0A1H4C7H1_XYLRU|nr:CDP-glycerol:poly(glycerophosphate) glycerophosphotransferase [Xylanibacter ruminicola]